MNTTIDYGKPTARDSDVATALRELPQLAPSEALMRRLADCVADGVGHQDGVDGALDRHPSPRRGSRWGGALLAASLIIAALIWRPDRHSADGVSPVAVTNAEPASSQLPALMAQSAYLESVLFSLPDRGRVQRVGTASTIAALEDRVALIDAQLDQPQVRASATGSEALWRQRVGLMNTLVELRGTPREQLWL